MNRNDFLEKYTTRLNEKQRQAVQTVHGPVLLLAVPGSGKTTVLVHRLGYMIYCEQIAPENILTLTYTVAATRDMEKRFESIFGQGLAGRLEFRTINGICSKIITHYGKRIGREPYQLITEEKFSGKILSDILVKILPEYPTENDIKTAKTLITYCKNMLLTSEEIEALEEEVEFPLQEVCAQYNQYLKQNNLMDYDDQMVYSYKILMNDPAMLQYYRNKYRYICVDEAQDTSKIQHLIITLLAGTNGNLFMVGDEDQSIYGFRAAYPQALLDFDKTHSKATILIMDQNYRSNAKIVAAADKLIQNNKERREKHIIPTREATSDVRFQSLNSRANQYNYLLAIAKNCCRETAILYRDNETVLPLIDRLDRQGVPYSLKGADMSFFSNRITTDIIAFLKFALNPYDTELFMKIYYKCKLYIRKTQAEELCRISHRKNIPVLSAIQEMNVSTSVKAQCRMLQTQFTSMAKELPSKAVFRIREPIGYKEYLSRCHIDDGKLFTVSLLASQETTISSFLSRLDYLRELVKNSKLNSTCNLILSTIHSSKGLEYDQVYLMDVCDGVFPAKVVKGNADAQNAKISEEERRLFYVGMTRAKNDLIIFCFDDNDSCFIKELREEKKKIKDNHAKTNRETKKKPQHPQGRDLYTPKSDDELGIGLIVWQEQLGTGAISSIDYREDESVNRFSVQFIGEPRPRIFKYPIAFQSGMYLIK